MQRLPKEILEKPEFESYFVGAESKIDQVPQQHLAQAAHQALDLEELHHGQHAQV